MNNIKMDLRETGWRCMDWVELTQDRDHKSALVKTAMELRFLKMFGNC
jgi:hypothetical protein